MIVVPMPNPTVAVRCLSMSVRAAQRARYDDTAAAKRANVFQGSVCGILVTIGRQSTSRTPLFLSKQRYIRHTHLSQA
jgi:hypothetical protein